MATLLKKQEEIANQLKQLKAREKDSERKADTRRKVIAGALALEHFQAHPDSEFAKTLFKLLDEYVEQRSRPLFAFLPMQDTAQDDLQKTTDYKTSPADESATRKSAPAPRPKREAPATEIELAAQQFAQPASKDGTQGTQHPLPKSADPQSSAEA
jgi:hypothetical protein